MSMAQSQATSGVDYGDDSKGLSWVVIAIAIVAVIGFIAWTRKGK